MGSLQRFNLRAIKVNYNIGALIETGTFRGDGIRLAIEAGIERIHSIEIDPDFYHRAVDEFQSHQGVSIHLGSSHELLPNLLRFSSLRGNALFWLDAHFPLADKGDVSYRSELNPAKRMPILSELEAIVRLREDFDDLIIIDDLRCFSDDPRIKVDTFDEHMNKLGARGEGCKRTDVVGVQLDEILFMTRGKYKHNLLFEDEGYIVLSRQPKS